MSTESYPEVHDDESGIVPPQNARTSEWPKKLRTLTAAELDRLTIDNAGRFYWDGNLVNYDTGPKQIADKTDKTTESLDRSMDILDRATYELGGARPPTTIEGELADTTARSHEPGALDLEATRAVEAALQPDMLAEPLAIRPAEPARLRLTLWQALGAVIVVLGIAVGAAGMATYGYVAALEWGCKTGTVHKGCPAPPPAPPQRPDIPA